MGGFLSFVALFVPLWWAWIGTTFYANRFDIFGCKARTQHRLAGMGVMLALAFFGAALSPLVLSSAIALVGLVQITLDIYQGKPDSFQA